MFYDYVRNSMVKCLHMMRKGSTHVRDSRYRDFRQHMARKHLLFLVSII